MTWLEVFRLVSALVGALAFGLLLYRLITTWSELPVLTQVLGVLLLLSTLGGTLLSYRLHQLGSPFMTAGVLTFLSRCGVVVVCVFWRRWLTRRTSPFRRTGGAAA